MRANTCYESTKEPRKWNDKGDPNHEISRNWNQVEEQVIWRMKDRRNKAKKITFQIKQDERKINSKLNIYKILMGVPWFFVKSRGVVGVPIGSFKYPQVLNFRRIWPITR